MKSKTVKLVFIILIILIIDQAVKVWVKTHMSIGGEIKIFGFDWALIHFVENEGMAFGFKFGGKIGKLLLSLFRIAAVGFLIYYLKLLIKAKANFGILFSFALILAGAIGNIIDSAFYGMIFSSSTEREIAMMFPPGGGYEAFLHGKVVDMLHFPVFKGHYPDWVPYFSGRSYLFFKPVFNIADTSITFGVLNILIFQRAFFKNVEENLKENPEEKDQIELSTLNENINPEPDQAPEKEG